MLYHSDEAAFEYIKNKRKYPDGALHLRYGNRFRKAYRDGENGDGKESGSASDSTMNKVWNQIWKLFDSGWLYLTLNDLIITLVKYKDSFN